MSRRVARRSAGIALAVTLGIGLSGGPARAGLPDWVESDRAEVTPASEAAADAYVLRRQRFVSLARPGRAIVRERGAVRVLRAPGAAHAGVAVSYLRRSGTVQDLRIWMVDANGAERRAGKQDALDRSLAGPHTLYSDTRQMLYQDAEARPGTVFAWEWTVEMDPLLADWTWSFQHELPVRRSSFAIELPKHATVEPRTGGGPIDARQEGQTWIWEARDLPARPVEPLASATWRARPWLVVRLAGPTTAGISFADWPDLARWMETMAGPARVSDGGLDRAAARLTEGLTDTLARVRAILTHVQRLSYVSIDLDIGRGDGYRPHPAPQVLELGYGDCKDKANLARCLLAAAGHESWLVLVNADASGEVDSSWASPTQFNHCIVAVRVPADTRLPSVARNEAFGAVLVFDPTDPYTVFGDLPRPQRGSWGVFVDGARGGLFRLPAPASDRTARRVSAALDSTGGLRARLQERHDGQHGRDAREERAAATELGYRGLLERRLAHGGAATVTAWRAEEDSATGAFHVQAEYEQPHFARIVQDLVTFRAPASEGSLLLRLPDSTRRQPVVLPAVAHAETLEIRLPPRRVVDELPSPLAIERDFGRCRAEWIEHEGGLRLEREWMLREVVLPPERYGEVRELFSAIRSAGSGAVVLRRP